MPMLLFFSNVNYYVIIILPKAGKLRCMYLDVYEDRPYEKIISVMWQHIKCDGPYTVNLIATTAQQEGLLQSPIQLVCHPSESVATKHRSFTGVTGEPAGGSHQEVLLHQPFIDSRAQSAVPLTPSVPR